MINSKYIGGTIVNLIMLAGIACLPVHAQQTATAPVDIEQVTVQPAVALQDVDGNFRRYEQYITPSDGIYINSVNWLSKPASGKELLYLTGHDIGQSSIGAEIWLADEYGAEVYTGRLRNSSFFRDWTAAGERLSHQDGRYGLAFLSSPSSRINITYDTASFTGPSGTLEEKWKRAIPGISFTHYENGGWRAKLEAKQDQLNFTHGSQISRDSSVYSVSLSPVNTDSSTIEANASFTRNSLQGINTTPEGFKASLEGSRDVSEDLSLSGKLFYDNVIHSIAESAFAKNDAGGQIEATFSGLPRTVITLGGGAHQVGYINSTQTEQFNTGQNNVFTKFTVRPFQRLKIKGSSSYDWTVNRPIKVDTFNNTSASFVWSNKFVNQAELSYNLSIQSGINASWRHSMFRNEDFPSRNSFMDTSISGWWMPNDKLTLNATVLGQKYKIVVPAFADNSVNNVRSVVVGGTYQLSQKLSTDLSFTTSTTRGSAPQKLQYFSLGTNYYLKSGDCLSAAMIFDTLDNNQNSSLEYNVNRFEIKYNKALY